MRYKNVVLLAILALCIGMASCKSSGGGIRKKDKCPGMRM
jgi:hypothetical protein